MLDRFTHLSRLRAIIEEGSLRRAAERLGITQPALSRSIQQLEQHFGRAVLERHARGVRPTPFGQQVLAASTRLMRQWELTEQELHLFGNGQRMRLRIGAAPVWRAAVLPEVIPVLHRMFPDITFEILRPVVDTAHADLAEGRLDLLLAGTGRETQCPRISAVPLARVPTSLIVREDHPVFEHAGSDGTVPSQALLSFSWLVYTEFAAYRDITIHSIFERLGQEPDVILLCDSLNTAIGILQRSDFIAFLPEPIAWTAQSPRLVRIPSDFKTRWTEVGLLVREEMAEAQVVQAVTSLCRAYFARAGLAPEPAETLDA